MRYPAPGKQQRSTRLTLRGIFLVLSSIALAIPGVLLGSDELVSVCLALLAVIAISFGTELLRKPLRLDGVSISPQPAFCGNELSFTPQLRNYSPSWIIEYHPPAQIGVTETLPQHEKDYFTLATRRGLFSAGAMCAQREDILGTVSTSLRWELPQQIIVYPYLFEIAVPGPGPGAGSTPGIFQTSFAADDVTLRKYEIGDELRRIHWAATARQGKLMVRSEESSAKKILRIILDNRKLTADTRGSEWVISAATSVAVAAITQDWRVQIIHAAPADSARIMPIFTSVPEILDFSATLTLQTTPTLQLPSSHASDGVMIGFLQDVDGELRTELNRAGRATLLTVYCGKGAVSASEIDTTGLPAPLIQVTSAQDLREQWDELLGVVTS